MKYIEPTMQRLVLIPVLVCCPLLILGALAFGSSRGAPNIRVQFVDSRVGWIVGPRLLHTTDGGQTWNVIREEGFGTFQAESIGFGHRVIQFINPRTGFQLDLNSVAKTTDGGRTWVDHLRVSKAGNQDTAPGSLFFLSPEVGWVVGESIYHTRDGGRNWEAISRIPRGDAQRQRNMRVAPTIADFIPALWFTDPENGFMARLDGDVYRTSDSGRNWKLIWSVDKRITDIFFIDEQYGWIVGDGGFIARTSDGGRTWLPAAPPTTHDLTSIFFLDRQKGWAVGSNSTILFTIDGGVAWKPASVPRIWGSPPLASVSFADARHGWAVGGNSDPMRPSLFAPSNLVLVTNDGGQTWDYFQP
jgi:photosystem II stability/assembly factor-like uncharacterized protein